MRRSSTSTPLASDYMVDTDAEGGTGMLSGVATGLPTLLANLSDEAISAPGKASLALPERWTSSEPPPGGSWHVGDFNGDGKDDIFRDISSTIGADVFLSNGTSFLHDQNWNMSSNGLDGWHVGDFNGDGKSDLFRVFFETNDEVLLSDGTAFRLTGTWLANRERGIDDHGNRAPWNIGDFNGDGKDDIFRYLLGSSGADVYLSTGTAISDDPATGFQSAGSWTPAGNGSDNQWHIGDFNGDGKDDIFRYLAGTGVDVFVSTGTSFDHVGIWTTAAEGVDDQGNPAPWNVGDLNGDGRDDIFRYLPGSSGADVFLSNGAAFVHDHSWTPAGFGSDNRWYVGDFNGDGTSDLLRQLTGHGADVLV